ncbi:MAG TPA: hypothetical protein DIT89_01260 [Planctomycetaceae bacterium]|nr:hypothetical protein [Planctomycetaceae bacterium]
MPEIDGAASQARGATHLHKETPHKNCTDPSVRNSGNQGLGNPQLCRLHGRLTVWASDAIYAFVGGIRRGLRLIFPQFRRRVL